jgi:hypothetical protein
MEFWSKTYNFQTKRTKKYFWTNIKAKKSGIIYFFRKRAVIFLLYSFWSLNIQSLANNKVNILYAK